MRAWRARRVANAPYKAASWQLLLSEAHSYGSGADGMDVVPPALNEVLLEFSVIIPGGGCCAAAAATAAAAAVQNHEPIYICRPTYFPYN